jgi:carboxymethylenebutenolidase
VSESDQAIQVGHVQFPGQAGTVYGYLARPRAAGRVPRVIVIPENMGLVEPNMDIARRFAKEGFVALAVHTVSRAGGPSSLSRTRRSYRQRSRGSP